MRQVNVMRLAKDIELILQVGPSHPDAGLLKSMILELAESQNVLMAFQHLQQLADRHEHLRREYEPFFVSGAQWSEIWKAKYPHLYAEMTRPWNLARYESEKVENTIIGLTRWINEVGEFFDMATLELAMHELPDYADSLARRLLEPMHDDLPPLRDARSPWSKAALRLNAMLASASMESSFSTGVVDDDPDAIGREVVRHLHQHGFKLTINPHHNKF